MSYKAELHNLGRKYKGKGDTISEAITSINPGKIVGKSILIVEKGDNKKERILVPVVAQRAFTGAGMMKEVAIKNLSLMFTGI